MITTVSITRYWKNGCLEKVTRFFCALLLALAAHSTFAQSRAEITQFRVERVDDEVVASGNIAFELPTAVEEALLKGVPLFFVVEADLLRERWYWYDRQVATARRHTRLAYQPLTRRWRLNVTAGAGRDGGVGLALNQSFDTLEQALSTVKRVSQWQIADANELASGAKYKVEFRFRLDLTQLPLPFQIGALGQSEWDLAAAVTVPLVLSLPK